MKPGRTPVPSMPSVHSRIHRPASDSALSENTYGGRYMFSIAA
jgi:hypothetical protein